MKKNKKIIIITALVLSVVSMLAILRLKNGRGAVEVISEIKPALGSINVYISTTGTVYPRNRLAIKPPVGGRLENILVREGENVKAGQILAWMSSTERAALLDAARGQGEEKLKYWQEAYKPIALLAPIDGEVIVATTQPGQAVTTSDAVVVLSDQLIVRAQVDETDIGKISIKQEAVISLDAYPDIKISAFVDHIYYESETINNVTIYKVDLIPDKPCVYFRSGMNAAIDFITEGGKDILLVPVNAVHNENNEYYVWIKQKEANNFVRRVVELGITDEKNYEIISGVSPDETIVTITQEYTLSNGNSNKGTNPFMPKMPGMRRITGGKK
jgi:membrane fusion protein, macrolide-specific efflux system